MSTTRHVLLLALALGASPGAGAQAVPGPALTGEAVSPPPAPPDTARKGSARFFDPEDGMLDLSDFLDNPRGFLPIPVVVTEPAIGYGGGVTGLFLRPRKEAGEEGWSRPNMSVVGAFGTQNGTKGAFAGDASRWVDGRLRTTVGAATGEVHLDFYGLGTDRSSADQKVAYTLKFTTAIAQANWQLAPQSPWALGLRYVYADVTPSLREAPAVRGLADHAHVKVSAPTAILEFDTRDNILTPTQGLYAEASWLASRKGLGASEDFERFEQIVMGWQPLPHGVTLAARANYARSSAGAPFFVRPYVLLRGVPAMRYQGDQMASVELEGRWRIAGRWSGVAFGGAGATRTTYEQLAATKDVASAGMGFRYTIARRFGLDVGMDVAYSRGATAVYLVVGNSWFRP